jgi:hypothetical protein
MANRYYLRVVEIDTSKTVYENLFFTKNDIAEELEDWNPEEYCYSIDTFDKEMAE